MAAGLTGIRTSARLGRPLLSMQLIPSALKGSARRIEALKSVGPIEVMKDAGESDSEVVSSIRSGPPEPTAAVPAQRNRGVFHCASAKNTRDSCH